MVHLVRWIVGRGNGFSERQLRVFGGMLDSAGWCRSEWGRAALPRVRERHPSLRELDGAAPLVAPDLNALEAGLRALSRAVAPAEAIAIHADLVRLAHAIARASLSWLATPGRRRQRRSALIVFEAIAGSCLLGPGDGAGAPVSPFIPAGGGAVDPASAAPEGGSGAAGVGPPDAVSSPARRVTVRCVQVVDEAPDVRTFRLALPAGERFDYQPGQFTTVEIPMGPAALKRSYTLASSPSRPGLVEITVKRVADGRGSGWLHDHLRVGDSIAIGRAAGKFSCQLVSTREKLLFISGGSGITPVMSMSRYLHDTADSRDVIFLHSARTLRDLAFRRELDLLVERGRGFRTVFTLTNEPSADWDGFRGRISVRMLEDAVPDLRDRTVFLCGPTAFMETVREALVAVAFPMHHFHAESFGGAPALRAPRPPEAAPAVASPLAPPAPFSPRPSPAPAPLAVGPAADLVVLPIRRSDASERAYARRA